MARATFTPAQLEALRREFAKIETIDPCAPTYGRLVAMLDGLADSDLATIARAGVKFVSNMAVNRCIRRGIALTDKAA